VNADAKDGINLFIGDDDIHMKFNNFPHVSIEKYQCAKPTSVNIDMYPGETHKPTITLGSIDQYKWGDYDPEPNVVIQEVEKPVFVM